MTSLTYPLGTTEKERRHIRRAAKKYSVFRDVLLRKNPTSRFPYHRAVPLRHQIPDVLRDEHDHWTAGHQGIGLTFRKVARVHYWPRYYEDIKEYVLSCEVCQAFGPKPPVVGLNPLAVPKGILQEIMIDYMSLPVTPSGNSCILVGIDLFTHWIHLMAFPTEDAENTVIFIFEGISQYGIPKRIISDCGSHFDNQVLAIFLRRYGLKLFIGTPFYPKRTGQVERTVQSVRKIVQKMALSLGLHWDVWIPAVSYVLRISPLLPHGIFPFFLLYSRQPRLLLDYSKLTDEVENLETGSEDSLMILLEEVVDRSRNSVGYYTNLMRDKKSMVKSEYDKKAKLKKFKKGGPKTKKKHSRHCDGNWPISRKSHFRIQRFHMTCTQMLLM